MPGKKILMVIAPKNFRDEELFHTKDELEKAGYGITIASTTTDVAVGMLGGRVRPDKMLNEVNAADYDAVIFVGGSGSQVYFNDPQAHRIARDATSRNKLIGAICIAPSILANAGVLKGKRATVWDSEGARGPFASILTKGGAVYTGEAVTKDGKIITADGPTSARMFGRTIVEELK